MHVETCVETSVIQFNVRTFAPTSSAPSVAYPAQKKTPHEGILVQSFNKAIREGSEQGRPKQSDADAASSKFGRRTPLCFVTRPEVMVVTYYSNSG